MRDDEASGSFERWLSQADANFRRHVAATVDVEAALVAVRHGAGIEAPVDLAAVQADDALLDMLGASRVALRWAAGRVDRATGKIPQSSEERDPLACEFWRGYRAAATETAQTLRELAEGGSRADADLIRALVAWRREVDAEPIGELVDTETALAEIGVGRRTVSRSWRRSWCGPVTAALAVLVLAVSVAGLVAKEAHPGDLLWPAHELLYPDGR